MLKQVYLILAAPPNVHPAGAGDLNSSNSQDNSNILVSRYMSWPLLNSKRMIWFRNSP